MANSIQIHYLSNDFYQDYNVTDYPEIEHKTTRPYAVLLINIENNKFAIPFRTNINHKNCYKFKKTGRATTHGTGLDFTKAVIVNDSKYIGNSASIDNKEYIELSQNVYKIIGKFSTYVRNYIKYRRGIAKEYREADYRFTTLKFFEKELNI